MGGGEWNEGDGNVGKRMRGGGVFIMCPHSLSLSQRKRWEDIIREWTGLEFGKSKTAVENRKKWTNLVAKSSIVMDSKYQLTN